MRIKKSWPLMRNDRVCSSILMIVGTLPLLLDVHLFRINLFIALLIYVIDRTSIIL